MLSMLCKKRQIRAVCSATEGSRVMATVLEEELPNSRRRKRSSNWTEAETLRLLELRREQIRKIVARDPGCVRGSEAWDKIAQQLAQECFERREAKHVAERWDTLRRVYMSIEDHCSRTNCEHLDVIRGNREDFRFVPIEYRETWHQFIAECNPGKRRAGKKAKIHSTATANVDAQSAQDLGALNPKICDEAPISGNVTSDEYSSTFAIAFKAFIRNVEAMVSSHAEFCDLTSQRCGNIKSRSQTAGLHEEEEAILDGFDAITVKLVAALQSWIVTMDDAKLKSTSSELYLLEFQKRDWHFVKDTISSLAGRYKDMPKPTHPWDEEGVYCTNHQVYASQSPDMRSNMDLRDEKVVDCPKSQASELDSPDSPQVRRSYITASLHHLREREFKKLIWPPDDKEPVTITKDDLTCLEVGKLVNGNIVDFYVKYLQKKHSKVCGLHFFNNYFFTKVAMANLNMIDFESVKRWIKVDMFQQDFVFLPIVLRGHWSLIIICYLGRFISSSTTNDKMEARILHLNSIQENLHSDVENHIRFLLEQEWTRRHYPEILRKKLCEIPFVVPLVPQQDNNTDCALFILEYMEQFLEAITNHDAHVEIFSFLTKNWFPPSTCLTKRTTITNLILTLDNHSACSELLIKTSRHLLYHNQTDFKVLDLNISTSVEPSSLALSLRGDAAVKCWKNDYVGALQDLEMANNFQPNDPLIISLRGHIKRKIGDYPSALSDLDMAISLESNFPNLFCRRAIDKHMMDAMYSLALQDLDVVNELRPSDPQLLSMRGYVMGRLGLFVAASLDLVTAASLESENSFKTIYRMANVKAMMHDLEGALQDLEMVDKLQPQDARVLSLRGYVKGMLHHFEDALEDLNAAHLLEPEKTVTIHRRANVKCIMGDFDGALQDLNMVNKQYPNDPGVLSWRGYVRHLVDQSKEALDDLNEANFLEPGNSITLHRRALIRCKWEDFEGALQDLDMVDALNASDPQILFLRGYVKGKLGQLEVALEDLDAAVIGYIQRSHCFSGVVYDP